MSVIVVDHPVKTIKIACTDAGGRTTGARLLLSYLPHPCSRMSVCTHCPGKNATIPFSTTHAHAQRSISFMAAKQMNIPSPSLLPASQQPAQGPQMYVCVCMHCCVCGSTSLSEGERRARVCRAVPCRTDAPSQAGQKLQLLHTFPYHPTPHHTNRHQPPPLSPTTVSTAQNSKYTRRQTDRISHITTATAKCPLPNCEPQKKNRTFSALRVTRCLC
mmetsp:Transcript_11205/g.32507  ORF Transcript_11205/g.32507 Transcript_11205/m.32507 type:complete len:217 (+) Transcript_11205:350-1000(+)